MANVYHFLRQVKKSSDNVTLLWQNLSEDEQRTAICKLVGSALSVKDYKWLAEKDITHPNLMTAAAKCEDAIEKIDILLTKGYDFREIPAIELVFIPKEAFDYVHSKTPFDLDRVVKELIPHLLLYLRPDEKGHYREVNYHLYRFCLALPSEYHLQVQFYMDHYCHRRMIERQEFESSCTAETLNSF